MKRSGLHRSIDAESRPRRRIAGPFAGNPTDILSFQGHRFHVGRAAADVFGGDVATSQSVYETAVRAEKLLAVFGFVIADDDRFAATKRHSSCGALVGHRSR